MMLFAVMGMAVSILIVPSTGNASVTATSGQLVAYWAFDETSGVRNDSTPNNNDLTDNNTVSYATGIISNGADFERSNSEYLSITDASQTGLDLTNDFSVSMWINPESLSSGIENNLVGKYANASNQRSYTFSYYPNTTIFRMYNSSNGINVSNADISYSLSTGTWYHVVGVYDASAGSIQVYVNGSSVSTATGLNTSIYNSSAPFHVGYIADLGTSYWDGIIDELSIWNTTLSGSDITSLYNSGTGLSYADLFTPTSTTSTSTATTTSSVDVEELKWVLELYLAIFMFLLFTWLGYRFTKVFI